MANDSAPDGQDPSAQSADEAARRPNAVVATATLVVAVVAIPMMIVACGICAVIPGIAWWVGLPIGLAIAVGFVLLRLRNASTTLLRDLQAAPADTVDYARFHNLAQGLALAGGVNEPELYVVPDDGRNAAAVAQGDRCAIVATTGLLDSLDRISLEGVIAEALVRISSGDAEAATVGAVLLGSLLNGPAGIVLKPAATFGLQRLLPNDRDLSSDRAAVALTRYPPGLAAAFTTIRDGSATVGSSNQATEHVWLVRPSTVDAAAVAVVPGGAPLDLRIDVLGEL